VLLGYFLLVVAASTPGPVPWLGFPLQLAAVGSFFGLCHGTLRSRRDPALSLAPVMAAWTAAGVSIAVAAIVGDAVL